MALKVINDESLMAISQSRFPGVLLNDRTASQLEKLCAILARQILAERAGLTGKEKFLPLWQMKDLYVVEAYQYYGTVAATAGALEVSHATIVKILAEVGFRSRKTVAAKKRRMRRWTWRKVA